MRKANLLLTITIVVLMHCSLTSNATIWRVNNNPNYTQGCNHCFSSLQAANDTSIVMAGDTIHLEASNTTYAGPGTADETLITKHLVILGPGYFLSQNSNLQKNTVSATIAKIRFDTGSENSILKGVRIFRVGGSDDLTIAAGNILIEGCYVEEDVDFDQASNIVNVTIKKCYLNGRITGTNASGNVSNLLISNTYIGGSIFFDNPNETYSGEISHCVIVAGGGGNAIDIRSDIQSFHNNIVTRNTGGIPVTLINQNDNGNNIHDNIFIDVLPNFATGSNNILLTSSYVFVQSGSQDSLLNVKSIIDCPECYTGFPTGTETMGMYGGADPYRLSGIPNIPSIYQLVSPLNILQGGTINVNISTRSND